jgi:cytochrome c5
MKLIIAALTCASLMGCDEKQATLAPVTLDARLQDIYSHTCAACHADAGTGAPQTHDVAAWAPRLSQGGAILLTHMVEGFNDMPPLGQCVECSADDLTALMHFMAAPDKDAENRAPE